MAVMTTTTPCTNFGALFIICYFTTPVLSWCRFRKIANPSFVGLSYLPAIIHDSTGRSHEFNTEINDRYGSLARIGPNDLLRDDPELIRRMSAVRSTYKRRVWCSR